MRARADWPGLVLGVLREHFGKPCPTNRAMAAAIGCSHTVVAEALGQLVASKRIAVRFHGRQRCIRIPGEGRTLAAARVIVLTEAQVRERIERRIVKVAWEMPGASLAEIAAASGHDEALVASVAEEYGASWGKPGRVVAPDFRGQDIRPRVRWELRC